MVPVCFCERFFKICGTFAPLPQHHILHKPLQRSWLCKIEGSQFGARNFAKASRVLYVWFIRKIYDSISYVVHVNVIYHDILVDFFPKGFNYHRSTKEPRKMGAPPRAFRATAGKPGVVKVIGRISNAEGFGWYTSGQIMIFHQPRFPCNKGNSLPKRSLFGWGHVRSL